jgi:hypothetical protein
MDIEFKNSQIEVYQEAFSDGLYIAGARDEWEAIGDAMGAYFGMGNRYHISGCSEECNDKLHGNLVGVQNLGSLLFEPQKSRK